MNNNEIANEKENIQYNNKEEEKFNPEKKLERRKFNFAPFETINYSKFDEMRKQLDDYFLEIYECAKDDKKIEGEGFKKMTVILLEKTNVNMNLQRK